MRRKLLSKIEMMVLDRAYNVPYANHRATSLASPFGKHKEEGQKLMEDDT